MWPKEIMGYYSDTKKNAIGPPAATWMDLASITLSEDNSDRERQISHDIVQMWNKKKDTKERHLQNRKRLTDLENKLMVTKGGSVGEGDKLGEWD